MFLLLSKTNYVQDIATGTADFAKRAPNGVWIHVNPHGQRSKIFCHHLVVILRDADDAHLLLHFWEVGGLVIPSVHTIWRDTSGLLKSVAHT